MGVVFVDSQGSIVIPEKIRKMFGIHSGSRMEVTVSEEKIVLEPMESLIDKRGSLKNIFRKEIAMGLINESRLIDKKHEKILESGV